MQRKITERRGGLLTVMVAGVVAMAVGAGCGRMPEDFLLTTDSRARTWLNEEVSVKVESLSLNHFLELSTFRQGNFMLLGRKAGQARVTLDVRGRSRRWILWRIGQMADLAVAFDTRDGVETIVFCAEDLLER